MSAQILGEFVLIIINQLSSYYDLFQICDERTHCCNCEPDINPRKCSQSRKSSMEVLKVRKPINNNVTSRY